MTQPIYNAIGTEYDNTRRADPYITSRILSLLAPKQQGVYLDVGCGTGNYLAAFTNAGIPFYGVDPSETMLGKATAKAKDATIIQGTADALPVIDSFFDGATAMFTFTTGPTKRAG